MRYRYYDSSDGRFNTRDSYLGSINNPLTLNGYAYTTNNPVNYIDPSGHYMVRNYSVMMSDGGGGIPKPRNTSPTNTIGKSIINTYKGQSYLSKTILSNVNNKVKAIQSKSIGASATSVLGSRTSLLNNKYINGISIIAKVKRVSKYCTTNNTANEEEPGSPGYRFVNAYYLNDSSRVVGQGHSAILLEMENGEAYFFSATPSKIDINYGMKIITGFDVPGHIDTAYNNNYSDTINVKSFLEGGTEYLHAGEIIIGPKKEDIDEYNRYVKIPISNDEGLRMFLKAKEFYENYKAYNLYSNNYGMIAMVILEAGGKNFIETGNWSADDEIAALERMQKSSNDALGGASNMGEIIAIYLKARFDYTIPNAAYDYLVEQIDNNNPNMKGWRYGDIKE